ncbi:MAG TPA: hypothetical protein VFN53_10285 [Acidobacteriaceae bacterium]|nr:hypothetical protein [Acidobacteriaceae bacterium]
MPIPTLLPASSIRRDVNPRGISRLERATNWIDNRPVHAFSLLTLGYALAVSALSWAKLLWLDELITLHIARLGSGPAIWRALSQGADPNPPLLDLLALGCLRLFGNHALSLRLPAMAGYWIGMAALFGFLRRRLSGTWSLAGVAMSLAMAAFNYSYEGRSYGLLYGLAMLAVLCWAWSLDPSLSTGWRNGALAGMVMALAAGISTNYFAVLAFLPIAGGEMAGGLELLRARKWRSSAIRASFHGRVWVGLALAAAPLLAYRHLIQRAIAEFAPYAWNKVSLDQVADSYMEMVEIILYPLLALFVFSFTVLALSRFCSHCRSAMYPRWLGRLASQQAESRFRILPTHEAAAVFLLMTYPILGYVVASIHGGMLSPRFVIPVCFGFAIAATLACYRIFGHFHSAGIVVLVSCLTWFAAREAVIGYWYMQQKHCFYNIVGRIPAAEYPGEPIVIPDPLMALTFRHYAPAELADRVVFPVDFPIIRLYRTEDSPEENLWAGRKSLYQMPIVTLASFQRSAGKYLMLASDDNWMIEDLLHHRYPLQRLPINTGAAAIGGFTPLAHGTPVFFTSVGDAFLKKTPGFILAPVPFLRTDNLPSAKLTHESGRPFRQPWSPSFMQSR